MFVCYRQPVLADEVQTFKALITIHKVLQEGHPIVVREAQQHSNWIDSLMRGVGGDGIRGMILCLLGPRYASEGGARGETWMLTMNRIRSAYSRICVFPRIEAGLPSQSP